MVPAWDVANEEVVSIDDENNLGLRIPYTDFKLRPTLSFLWRGKALRDGSNKIYYTKNYCPKCKAYRLEFQFENIID